MKKRILSIALLILVAASAGFAQTVEQQVAKIRQLYAATNKRIDEGIKDKISGLHYAAWTIGGERDGQQWRAVGTMRSTDEFYFDCEPNDTEGCNNSNPRNLVRKIISTYAGAKDLRTRNEYVFNEAGELVFAFTGNLTNVGEDNTEVLKMIEQRFYFAKGKLIRVNRNDENVDAKFAAEDNAKAKNIVAETTRLRNIFALMFAE